MPKPRTLDPFFWDDPDVAVLSRDERLLMVGIILKLADDEGRLLADPAYIRKELFGWDLDLTTDTVAGMLTKLCTTFRTWHTYSVERHSYIEIDPFTWMKWQPMRWRVRSKLPARDGSVYVADNTTTSEVYGALPHNSEEYGSRARASSVVQGSVEYGSEKQAAPENPPQHRNGRSAKRGYREIIQALGPERTPWWEKAWKLFPCHEGKQQAMDSFERVVRSAELWEKVLDGIIRYAAKIAADPTLKVKYMQGWLNDARWDDEYLPASRIKPQTATDKAAILWEEEKAKEANARR